MGYAEDAQNLISYVESIRNVGAKLAEGTTEQIPEAGLLTDSVTEWVADNGTQKKGTYVRYKGILYYTATDIQRIANYAPDMATNNYFPCPKPDKNGVYPYMYGMLAKEGMKISKNGVVYVATSNVGNAYKLVYAPSTVPALFIKQE